MLLVFDDPVDERLPFQTAFDGVFRQLKPYKLRLRYLIPSSRYLARKMDMNGGKMLCQDCFSLPKLQISILFWLNIIAFLQYVRGVISFQKYVPISATSRCDEYFSWCS